MKIDRSDLVVEPRFVAPDMLSVTVSHTPTGVSFTKTSRARAGGAQKLAEECLANIRCYLELVEHMGKAAVPRPVNLPARRGAISKAIKELAVNQEQRFTYPPTEASSRNIYATIRGVAYGLAKKLRRRYGCARFDHRTIVVRRYA